MECGGSLDIQCIDIQCIQKRGNAPCMAQKGGWDQWSEGLTSCTQSFRSWSYRHFTFRVQHFGLCMNSLVLLKQSTIELLTWKSFMFKKIYVPSLLYFSVIVIFSSILSRWSFFFKEAKIQPFKKMF